MGVAQKRVVGFLKLVRDGVDAPGCGERRQRVSCVDKGFEVLIGWIYMICDDACLVGGAVIGRGFGIV